DPGAQQTHTYLQIHTMMLSPKARLDAIPSVLVSADDVSASHGGTVGELDEAAIFYMQSRGLDRPAAVRVLVEGFFEPVLAELRDEPLEELIRAKLAAKLASAREDIEAYAPSRWGIDAARDDRRCEHRAILARRTGRLPDLCPHV